MKKHLLLLMLLALASLLKIPIAWAYGPFVLPIHNNSVQINGGAWNYSDSCIATGDHNGVDFDGEEGDSIYPAASGVVTYVKNSDCSNTCYEEILSWGCYINIGHDIDGDGSYEYTTKYAHLKEGSVTVSVGNGVTTDTVIAQMGNTGYSCGAHLHFGLQENTSWLDPYNLYGDSTCCDIPNGCPNEGSASQHSEFNCGAAGDSGYLWASCPPTYDAEVEDSSSTSRSSKITTEFNSLFSTYNIRNKHKNECSDAMESPNFLLDNVTDSLHWWNYSGSGDPNPSSYYRDDGKYTTLLIENYDSDDERYCADDGAIVYDEFGGANRAYTVQCQHWNAWRTRNGPEGAPTQSYPRDCGAPITNVYGQGDKWVQDFQDCIIVYNPDDDGKDGTCETKSSTFVHAYPKDFAPGELANGTWSTIYSYLIAEKYELKGASKRFGYPLSGVCQNGSYSLQTFRAKNTSGHNRVIYYDSSTGTIKVTNSSRLSCTTASSVNDETSEVDTENSNETDADNDSWSVADGDCNDLSNGVHPTHEELSDAVDNDCDDVIDEDLDNDGVMTEDGDCNDLSNGIYPTHPEDIDNRDNNCDGLIDNDPYPDLMVYYPPIGGWWTAKNWEGDTLTYYTNLFQGYFTQGAHENWYRFPKETCDVNGDLFTDILVYSPAGEWTVIESDEDTLSTSTRLWATSYGTDSTGTYYEAHCGDFNGDGYDDAMLYALHGGYYVRLSNGSSFQWSPDNWMPGCNCGAQAALNQDFTILVGDFNGDTLDDVLLYHLSTGTWYVGVSTGSGFNLSTWYTNFGGPGYTPLVGDINGDTLDDIAIMSETDGHWNTLLSTGTSFAQQAIWIEHHGGSGYQPFLEDMNGDTLDDAIIFTPINGSWSIALSTGSSFSTPSAWITNFGTDATGTYGVVPFITKTHR